MSAIGSSVLPIFIGESETNSPYATGGATLPLLLGYGQTLGGVGSALLPFFSGSGSAEDTSAVGEADLPLFSSSGYGGSVGVGVLPVFTGNGSGYTPSSANGAATLAQLFGAGTAIYTEPGVGSAILPFFTVSGAGHQVSFAAGSASIPLFTGWGFGFGEDNTTVVVNLRHGIPTEYTGWHFNSFCKYKDMYLGAGDDGISRVLYTDMDNGSPILFCMRLGLDSLDIPYAKRAPYAYLTYRGNGMMMLEVEVDEQEVPDTYSISAYADEKLKPYRFKLSEEREGDGWTFEIQNFDGSSVEINKFEVVYTILTRRI